MNHNYILSGGGGKRFLMCCMVKKKKKLRIRKGVLEMGVLVLWLSLRRQTWLSGFTKLVWTRTSPDLEPEK